MSIRIFLVCLGFLLICNAGAHESSDDSDQKLLDQVDVIDWNLAQKRMKSLSQVGFHPFLMPLIMENRDFIELTEKQVKLFMAWRNKNRVPLLHVMNKIIYERNLFHKLALSPNTREEVLITKQEEIFKLHRKVLEYQLSCRRNILDTFTPQQWDNFRFVLSENGYEID